MTRYLLAIDQGTSSCRAIVFSEFGEVEAVYQQEFPLYYPQSGWVEQKPSEILEGTLWALRGCAQHCREKGIRIEAIGITNQRETTILWDRHTGEPVYNAIVWQDRRTADLCRSLKERGVEAEVQAKTGLLLDPYFSATKIRWILDNVSGARERAECGDLCFGTVDSYLLWHLSTEQIHATDLANASRTMLSDVNKKDWCDDLLQLFNVPRNILPKIGYNISNYGQLIEGIFDHKIPIFSMVGDQQSALIGQGCIKLGMIKSTYGTGCFALMNIGEKFKLSKNRLLTTVGIHLPETTSYAIEGAIFNAGTAIQFLRDNLGLFAHASETEIMANSIASSEGVYFVPALTGLGAPYWDSEARGMIMGLDRHTGKAHIVRAALEAQGYQTRDLLTAMEEDSGQKVQTIRADGGLVANKFMCQFLADITQRPVEIPAIQEATAWGAACLAGIGAGVFSNLEQAAGKWKLAHLYEPQISAAKSDNLYAGWKDAVSRVLRT